MTYYKKNKFKTDLYPKDIFEKLEFDKILELLTEKCYSPLGKKYVEHLKVQTNPELIQKMLIQVNEFKQMLLYEEQQLPNNNFLDLKEELHFLSIQNAVLSEQQVFRVFKVLLVVIELVRYFEGVNNERIEKYPNLYNLVEKVSISRALINEIKKVLDKEGRIRSDASKELKQIRKQITNKYRDLDRRFVSVVNEYKKNGWLADNLESVRNGRRVLAVRAEHKRKIRGIIHDESQTGSTTFIEPDSTLRINNEIVEFQQAERREIYRILQILTKALQPYHEELAQYQKLLGLIDFIRAKGRLAWELQAQMPHISPQKNIELYNARHPLLFLKKQKDTVPLSLNLSLSERILLVSGPNAGGKSVLLKTVGLLQLMLQTGMLVPVDDHSVMSIFRNIYVDIGDEQSIENDLSTYSSRLKNMRYYCDFANNKTLMLIDEFGSGTDPALGGAIAEAILEHLNKKFCYGVITTHYSNLKVYATRTTGIINGAMAFDYKTLSPKYKLEIGKPGSSFAFELAVKSGLKADLIEVAKSKVDANYKEFDELLSTMQREKQEVMERERIVSNREQELQELIATYNVKNRELEKQRKKIILETEQKALSELNQQNKKFEKLVEELRENKAEKKAIKKIKAAIQQDKIKLSRSIEILKDDIFYRDSKEKVSKDAFVRLRNGREVGVVAEIRKNNAIVQFDVLKTHVKIRDLVVVEPIKPKAEKSFHFYNSLEAKASFESNIDIRGERRDTALKIVEELLDRAIIYNVDEIKIIHGIGDGILRKSIRHLLRGYKEVKAVRDEDPQYGGSGVSIVEIR